MNPTIENFREHAKYYIPSTPQERQEMLEYCGYEKLSDIYSFLDTTKTRHCDWDIGEALSPTELKKHLEELSLKNRPRLSFLGNGLPDLKLSPISAYLGTLRKLCTAYTPYQPELGQGTLIGLQIYSSMMQKITGMEAINASLYDRSTAIFEAIQTSIRINKNTKNTALVLGGIYPNDLEVLQTLIRDTQTSLHSIPLDKKNGQISINEVREWLEINNQNCSCIVIPQVNHLGIIENFDALTDLAFNFNTLPIAVIDPFHLFPSGLTKPRFWGSNQKGVPIMVGEGQHLAIAPNYGGPGLGIFAVQYNESDRQSIRSMPGRLVGKTKDSEGRDCFTLIMSTREQHIRREKATSNICSNQSFLALAAGACLLEKGYQGLGQSLSNAKYYAKEFQEFIKTSKFELAYPDSSIINEVLVRTKTPAKELIKKALDSNLHIGSLKGENLILVSFSDKHTTEDFNKLVHFFDAHYSKKKELVPNLFTLEDPTWPHYSFEILKQYYQNLDNLNLTPDDKIYPLGSCTMKYNPLVNEYAANLPGFTNVHPDVPMEDAQGTLEILYQIQELFKSITGLPHVTGMPVAGAQGELVGLKMFQRYFENIGPDELKNRKYLLIPKSAHGTNPATAAVANLASHLILLDADESGHIDLSQIKDIISQYGQEIFGVMITNPNTSGIYIENFKEIADLIHSVGGLVYMDGANMNAIAGQVNLQALGVDAVHNNLHKTWSIPHGGGGPGDAIVAVSEKLKDFLPAPHVRKVKNTYELYYPKFSMGRTHRHIGNVAHKIRCYTYIKALGTEGVKTMSAMATLSAQYLFKTLNKKIPCLPTKTNTIPRMHEFILTLDESLFQKIIASGIPKTQIIGQMGKMFLDYGFHAPTVAFPEPLGLMIEPTESFTKKELDAFIDLVLTIYGKVEENPLVLKTAPHFTPIAKVDELFANKQVNLNHNLQTLPIIYPRKEFYTL